MPKNGLRINLHSTKFQHHRSGWSPVVDVLREYKDDAGIRFFDYADYQFKVGNVITKEWAGFLHNVVTYPKEEMAHKYQKPSMLMSLSQLVENECFRLSMKHCKGLFTLSNHTAGFLRRHVSVRVESITHPVLFDFPLFDLQSFLSNPRMFMAGQWMRRIKSFYELKSNIPKFMLKIDAFSQDYEGFDGDVKIVDYLEDEEYDKMMQNSMIFLSLYDVSACNTIIECISRNTPLLVNALPAVVEYLGEKYPLYYHTIDEASQKIQDISLVVSAHEYLKSMDKRRFTLENFERRMVFSKVFSPKKIPML